MNPDEFRFQLGLAVLKQHLDYFGQIVLQLVEGFTLRMGTGKTGNVSNEQSRFRAPFDYGSKRSHFYLHQSTTGVMNLLADDSQSIYKCFPGGKDIRHFFQKRKRPLEYCRLGLRVR